MLPEPFLSWLHALYVLLRENDEKALFLLLLIEEAGVPLPFVPGDVLIMFAGYRASTGEMGVVEAILVAIPAVQLGSTLLYTLSRKFGHALLFKFGRYIHLDEAKLNRIERWIQRRGPVMVLIGRLTPGMRTPTSVMAGVFEVPFSRFLLFTTLSAVLWGVFWLSLGYFAGNSLLPLVRRYHTQLSLVAFGAAAVAVMVGLVVMRWRRKAAAAGNSHRPLAGGRATRLDS